MKREDYNDPRRLEHSKLKWLNVECDLVLVKTSTKRMFYPPITISWLLMDEYLWGKTNAFELPP
jgi:hypothetical protein